MLGVVGAAATAVLPRPPAPQKPLSRAATNAYKRSWASPLLPLPRSRRGLSVLASSRRHGAAAAAAAAADEDEDRDDDEEEVESMPFKGMRRWLENKPVGFGEGRTYDTSVEERLMEEMERSRNAQLASKLKSEPKKQEPQKKELDVPKGTRVRVSNLPRKKNICRDLQLAFKGFPGIINISPAVTGNQKTRDPICKGFAFLDLESEEVARRFVQMYSKKNVVFGKLQKQITCGVMNASSLSTDPKQSSDGNQTVTQLKFIDMEDEMATSSYVSDLSWSPQERIFDGSIIDTVDDEAEEEICTQELNTTLLNDAENGSLMKKDDSDSDESLTSSQKQEEVRPRKKRVKTKPQKSAKLSVPASLVRLKVKERAILTGVFSKYGGKIASSYKDA